MKMLFATLFLCLGVASAQSAGAPEVVPIDKEPSHHLVFENEYVRVFRVEVAPHAETKYHQHDRDYVWVALGDSDVESVRVGGEPVHLQPKDGDAQFSKGGFAHKAINKSDKPFRNVTVELKEAGKVLSDSESDKRTDSLIHRLVVATENARCFHYSSRSRGVVVFLKTDRSLLVVSASPIAMKAEPRGETTDVLLGEAQWFPRVRKGWNATGRDVLDFTACAFDKKGKLPKDR